MTQPTEFRAAEKQSKIRAAYLYIVQYGTTTFHLCYNDRNLTVTGVPAELGNNTSQEFGAAQIRHKSARQSIEVGDNKLSLTVGINNNLFGLQLRQFFLYSNPEDIYVTIVRAQKKDGVIEWAKDCVIQFTCVVNRLKFGGPGIVVELVSLILLQNGRFPRYYYQKTCQKVLGDQAPGGCGLVLDADAHRLETELTGVTRAGRTVTIGNITIDGDPITAETFQGGKLWVLDGSDVVARIAIQATELLPASAGVRLYLLWWAPQLTIGVDVKVFKGCRRTIAACEEFGNINNYGGFAHVPETSPSISSVA